MAVELALDRKAVEITWNKDALEGDTVEILCVNPENEDISSRTTENDGRAVITFPADYSGETEVFVSADGSQVESGTIKV